MPQYFHFSAPGVQFNAPLQCERCTFIKKDGHRCKRSVCIGLDVCSTHLPYKYKVKIATSLIPNSGKGLFAHEINAPDDKIIFRKDQTICPYNGESIEKPTLDSRYGEYTAPYGYQTRINPPKFEDAATRRGIGSLVNHRPGKFTNARLALSNGKGIIKATKNIRQGDELYVNYGSDYKMNEPTQYVTNYKKNFVF